jgi:hypothetical protein
MGIPIMIKQTESERNREGQMEAAKAKQVFFSLPRAKLMTGSHRVNGNEN